MTDTGNASMNDRNPFGGPTKSEAAKLELKVDMERIGVTTGAYVRAIGLDGTLGNYDIGELDRSSLVAWLRTKDWIFAESVILLLLGHQP